MAQLSNKLVSKLRHIAAALQAFLDEIDAGSGGSGSTVKQLPAVAKKIAKRECLVCGRDMTGKRYKRGLCERDYMLTMRRIAADDWNEQERIDAGLLAWPDKSGATAEADKVPRPTLEQDKIEASADLKKVPSKSRK